MNWWILMVLIALPLVVLRLIVSIVMLGRGLLDRDVPLRRLMWRQLHPRNLVAVVSDLGQVIALERAHQAEIANRMMQHAPSPR